METKYFVNEDKRIIVCKIEFEDYYGDWHEITGKAKCSPEDEFDLEFGRRLANVRCHLEYHRFMKKLADKEADRLYKRLNLILDRIDHHDDIIAYMTLKARGE